jgi:hypothetical protein
VIAAPLGRPIFGWPTDERGSPPSCGPGGLFQTCFDANSHPKGIPLSNARSSRRVQPAPTRHRCAPERVRDFLFLLDAAGPRSAAFLMESLHRRGVPSSTAQARRATETTKPTSLLVGFVGAGRSHANASSGTPLHVLVPWRAEARGVVVGRHPSSGSETHRESTEAVPTCSGRPSVEPLGRLSRRRRDAAAGGHEMRSKVGVAIGRTRSRGPP